jgi:hypothetical protein
MTLAAAALGHDGTNVTGKDLRQLVEAIFYGSTGVVHGLAVTQQGSPAATVQVAAGKATVDATGSGLTGDYHVWNDAAVNSPTINPTTTNGRKDRLILRVTSGVPALEVVEGTASGSPAEPAITGDNYLELALITLPSSTTNVTDAMITDRRVYATAVGSALAKLAADSVTGRREGDMRYNTDTDVAEFWDGSAWKSVGHAARAWTVIEEKELSGTGALSFTSIPATFSDLMLQGIVRGSPAAGAALMLMRFNGDSGANYDNERIDGGGAAPAASSGAAATSSIVGTIPHASSAANVFAPFTLIVPGYADTSHYKAWTANVAMHDPGVTATVTISGGQWRSTAAVTQIALSSNNGWTNNFVAGTRVTLLGRR